MVATSGAVKGGERWGEVGRGREGTGNDNRCDGYGWMEEAPFCGYLGGEGKGRGKGREEEMREKYSVGGVPFHQSVCRYM
jgi:hypothetical protein